jgi:hypothetical protein
MQKKYYNTQEAAAYLCISPETLNQQRCYNPEKGPPFAKIGGRVIYPVDKLDAYIESRIVYK